MCYNDFGDVMDNRLRMPKHVAIILDGNGRWAKARGLTRSMGHKEGFENLTDLSEYIFNQGIEVLSVYAFSTENFKRDKDEVDYLMNLFVIAFEKYGARLNKSGIKVVFSGRREPLPEKVLKTIDKVTNLTKDNTKAIFNICVNYGGQYEILDAIKNINKDVIDGIISNDEITIDTIYKYMYQDLPPVDFMIRTSGEQRLSNFLLFQNAYAEFYFPETYFPAFDKKEFDKAIEVYNSRDRRFGNAKK